ncbi:hypothetical protein BDQ17DRAFT_1260717, partial [Cyathus striatus]
AFLALSIAFDALAFSMTFVFSFNEIRRNRRSVIIAAIQRDGVIYFATIFTTNLLWMILTLHARVSFITVTITGCYKLKAVGGSEVHKCYVSFLTSKRIFSFTKMYINKLQAKYSVRIIINYGVRILI